MFFLHCTRVLPFQYAHQLISFMLMSRPGQTSRSRRSGGAQISRSQQGTVPRKFQLGAITQAHIEKQTTNHTERWILLVALRWKRKKRGGEEKERQYSRFAKLNEYTSDWQLRPKESGKYLGSLGFTEADRTMRVSCKMYGAKWITKDHINVWVPVPVTFESRPHSRFGHENRGGF